MAGELADADGRVADWVPVPRQEPRVELRPPFSAPARVLAAATARWPGEPLDVHDPELAAAFATAGVVLQRHSHTLRLALEREPLAHGVPDGARLVALVRIPEDLGAVDAAAFPPEHPDHGGDAEAALDGLRWLAGGGMGQLLPASRLALGPDGRSLGATLLTRHDGPEPFVASCFRAPEPRWRGLGAALLAASLGALWRGGERSVRLSVTEGNPARRLYDRVGFQPVQTKWTFRLPGERPRENPIE